MTNLHEIHDARIAQLHREYYEVRQHSIGGGADIDGWRVARLMRDAQTPVQADDADRKLNAWIKKTHSNSRRTWRPFRAFFADQIGVSLR
jgi:hypothetical protein